MSPVGGALARLGHFLARV